MELDQSRRFYAFISYNAKDIRWGKRLQRKLEHYRMPATLCSERGWKRKPMDPVFFAPYDIQPGGLSDELKSRLRASRNLVVICSPNSAKSEWVGKEIQYFHELGRDKVIHFFIVDGIPHSGDSATECFNPIVKQLDQTEILGANIHEKIFRLPWLNRERAYVQLISKLLGVEFDSIWKRHKRRLITKAVAWTIGSIAILTSMLLIWMNNQPFDTTVSLEEATIHNPELPPLKDAVITLKLGEETKTDTIFKEGESVKFVNIPHRYLGKDVRITFTCQDFIPLDTTIALLKEMTLKISRDADVYGKIYTELYDFGIDKPVAGVEVNIDQWTMISDAKGIVNLSVPLGKQKTEYTIKIPKYNITETITVPTNGFKTVGVNSK